MTVELSLAAAHDLAVRVLSAAGATEANARPVADAVVTAQAEGIHSHGLTWLTTFADHLEGGKVDGKAEPQVTQAAPASLSVDARSGFAHPAIVKGIERLIPLARETGVAALAVKNSYNCLVVGHHVRRIAEAGLVALGFVNSPKSIAPWGGTKAVFGTNPLAFACPRADGAPLVVDQSSSKVARSEIRLAQQEGREIPLGWALDVEGKPTTDAAAAMAGTVLPYGDYKGYGIALMVDLMAGAMAGARYSHQADSFVGDDGGTPGTGQFFLAIDPGPLGGADFTDRADGLCSLILDEPGVQLPGDKRLASLEKTGDGPLSIPKALFDNLQGRVRV
ncbi:MAG: Ldh family oxidoreductase [Rhodospirillales bacterium]|nr:Ldh family oxidoreductase [Rhodospirillales bacterium]